MAVLGARLVLEGCFVFAFLNISTALNMRKRETKQEKVELFSICSSVLKRRNIKTQSMFGIIFETAFQTER